MMSTVDSIFNGAKEPTYVYDGVEVKLTGRTATKSVSSGMSRNKSESVITIYEIVSVDTNTYGENKKWVEMDSLFVIRGE